MLVIPNFFHSHILCLLLQKKVEQEYNIILRRINTWNVKMVSDNGIEVRCHIITAYWC